MRETSEERDKRIVEMLAMSRADSTGDSWDRMSPEGKDAYRQIASAHLNYIRAHGGDVAIPDPPKPTYTATLTEDERTLFIGLTQKVRNGLALSKTDRENAEMLHMRIYHLTPDPS